ncbi:iron uptake transporter permease EfeU [Intrasporangium calvum]|uniref:Iron permease FTR1 n=1 Tax=Intrasporangium calvum (strain ATCC 23552 / DSM 43043 / JCM 3097 / NBRC 12989 / NCIMB 10167 / NRRL B-3866 / 7 KIP) TaxID=710696 RepID=E6S5Z6_INTC7|nr:iron uptake transporter permease EfeU [Intrasporangium calvum]ADU46736.1 iron permease FTR1 [Intrasporangium calvum DSM 43043]
MLVSNALIGLREGLEAALVVVILVAFLVKTGRHWALRWVWLGVGTAVALSVVLGAVLTYGTSRLSFEQQELIGGFASIIAVVFVTGMVFWMRSAARTISGELRGRLDRALDLGPLAVALVGFLGVGREGLETAIFFYATTQAAGAGNSQPLIGWVLGLTGAVALGGLIYRGAVRINLTAFFRWTGSLLVVVAAGILAYGLHDLQEAGLLPGLGAVAFDISSVIAHDGWIGNLLRGIFNFTPQPTVVQAVAWSLYVAVILTLFLRPQRTSQPSEPAPSAPADLAARPSEPAPAN